MKNNYSHLFHVPMANTTCRKARLNVHFVQLVPTVCLLELYTQLNVVQDIHANLKVLHIQRKFAQLVPTVLQ
jgi:hypothetical protein